MPLPFADPLPPPRPPRHSQLFSCFPLLLFLAQLVAAIVLLLGIYTEHDFSEARCQQAKQIWVPAPPCEVEQNVTLVSMDDLSHPHLHLNMERKIAYSFAGGLFTSLLGYWYLFSKVDLVGTTRWERCRAFGPHCVEKSYIQIIQMAVTFVSFMLWAVWVALFSDNVSQWLTFLNPTLNREQFVTVLRWYTCYSSRHVAMVMGDAAVQGLLIPGVLVSLTALPNLRVKKMGLTMLLMDILHSITVFWSLPLSYYLPESRPYSLIVISGSIRAMRIFQGAPAVAKDAGYVLSKAPVNVEGQPRSFARNLSSRLLLFARLRKRFLWIGNLAIITKILFFMVTAALIMVGMEGWPCQFRVPAHHSPCDCSPDLRTVSGALYFTFTTLTTVGFGDIVPRTDIGKLVVVIIIFAGVYQLPSWLHSLAREVRMTRELQAKAKRESGQYRKHSATQRHSGSLPPLTESLTPIPGPPTQQAAVAENSMRKSAKRPNADKHGSWDWEKPRHVLQSEPALRPPQPSEERPRSTGTASESATAAGLAALGMKSLNGMKGGSFKQKNGSFRVSLKPLGNQEVEKCETVVSEQATKLKLQMKILDEIRFFTNEHGLTQCLAKGAPAEGVSQDAIKVLMQRIFTLRHSSLYDPDLDTCIS